MKNKIVIVLFIILNMFLYKVVNADEIDLSAKAAGVYTLNDLECLYDKNIKEKLPLASITKIMTAIVCIDNVSDLNEEVVVNLPEVEKYYDEDYSTAGLKDGQKISYYDLIATMLIPSGADSASCIALNVFGDYSKFIYAMNEKAKELGMNDTSFENPIGSDSQSNYSTVHDIALMMKYALSNENIKTFLSEYEFTTKDQSITVHNALFQLADIYGINVEKISGGKTGMTEDAQYCLASYSYNEEEPLICIVLGSQIKRGTLYHLTDSEKLYEYISQNYSMKNVILEGENITSIPGYHTTNSAKLSSSKNVGIYLKKEEEIDKEKLKIEYTDMPLISAKNKKGDVIGKASIYYKDKYITDIDLILSENMKFSIIKWSKDNPRIVLVIELIVIVAGVYCLIRRKKDYKKI